jgi:hypothetical protein
MKKGDMETMAALIKRVVIDKVIHTGSEDVSAFRKDFQKAHAFDNTMLAHEYVRFRK